MAADKIPRDIKENPDISKNYFPSELAPLITLHKIFEICAIVMKS